MKKSILIFIIIFLFPSCTKEKVEINNNIEENKSTEIETKINSQNVEWDNEIVKDIKKETIKITKKIWNQEISLSFNWDKSKFIDSWLEWANSFYYDWLFVTNLSELSNLCWAYYNRIPKKVEYECNWPLIKEVPYSACYTNGKDYLSQFEFAAFSDGWWCWWYTEQWNKIYIKNIKWIDFIFAWKLKWDTVKSDSINYKNDYNKLSQKKYLESILNDEQNIEKIKDWNNIVSNISWEIIVPEEIKQSLINNLESKNKINYINKDINEIKNLSLQKWEYDTKILFNNKIIKTLNHKDISENRQTNNPEEIINIRGIIGDDEYLIYCLWYEHDRDYYIIDINSWKEYFLNNYNLWNYHMNPLSNTYYYDNNNMYLLFSGSQWPWLYVHKFNFKEGLFEEVFSESTLDMTISFDIFIIKNWLLYYYNIDTENFGARKLFSSNSTK